MPPRNDSFLDPCPPVPTPTLPQSSGLSDALQVCHPHAAGIDIGEAEHWVAVPPGCAPQPVRRFGTCTAALAALADWLLDGGVTAVAMASTGVSWMPLFELLEARGVQVLLIDPRQAQRTPGRPTTDRLDCQWLRRLHAYGLLAGAFRPDDQVCMLRSSWRHRQMLLPSAAHHMQHMQKALQQMNRKLTQVVRAITGATGMAILQAIIAGERDPVTLAQLRNPPCQHDAGEVAKAWQGTWRAEPLCALQPAVARRLAARSVHHAPSALGAFFRRMKARLGTPKAITAIAHKLARRVSSLLPHSSAYVHHSNSRSKVCVKYAGPRELWNDTLVTTCEGQSRRRLSPLGRSANTAMLRTACFLCVIGQRELLRPPRAGRL